MFLVKYWELVEISVVYKLIVNTGASSLIMKYTAKIQTNHQDLTVEKQYLYMF